MDPKKLLKRLSLLIFFIFLLNSLAMEFHWYFSVWYFDMFMHFLGGFWVGLAVLWLVRAKEVNAKCILSVIVGVLVVGILWEVFEVFVDRATANDSFNILDTTSDIFFDLAGGLLSIFYFKKRIISVPENKI